MSAHAVLLEVRHPTSAAEAEALVDALLPDGASRDAEFTPVPMDGGRTWLVRCELSDAAQVATLEAHPDVVGVWPDSRVAPM